MHFFAALNFAWDFPVVPLIKASAFQRRELKSTLQAAKPSAATREEYRGLRNTARIKHNNNKSKIKTLCFRLS